MVAEPEGRIKSSVSLAQTTTESPHGIRRTCCPATQR